MNVYDLSVLKKKLFKGKNNKRNDKEDKTRGLLINQDKFAIVESYKQARSNLMFAVAAKESKTIVFTSANKSEGKSTSITNMAATGNIFWMPNV